ncbi:ribokinase, partial [Streptococcus anginosus]|nr:ribokinase [Streptococcus anginosus]
FERNGIDTTYVMRTAATSGVAPIFVNPDSQNSIIIVQGANSLLTPADIDAAAAEISRCKLIVLQLEIPLETVYYAIEFGVKH